MMNELRSNLKANKNWLLMALFIQLLPSGFIFLQKLLNDTDLTTFPVTLAYVIGTNAAYFFLILLFAAIKPSIPAKVMLSLLIVCNGIFNLMDLFVFCLYGTQFRLIFLGLLLNTTGNEIAGFFDMFFLRNPNYPVLLYGVSMAAALFLLKMKRPVLWLAGLGAVSIFSLFALFYSLPDAVEPQSKESYLSFPQMVTTLLDEQIRDEFAESDLTEANANAKAENGDRTATYILVIGESHSRSHCSLYGYFRDTNPELKKIREAGDLYLFTDAVAPHSLTALVMPKLLTYAAHDSEISPEHSECIFDLMKAAGFKTWFFCNQSAVIGFSAFYTAITRRADICQYTPSGWRARPDGELLPLLEKALQDPAPKKFIVLELLGSHCEYAGTYPADGFSCFTDTPDRFNADQKKNITVMNHYDNSVLYNDHILAEMIRMVPQNHSSFLMYLSDHGENLLEAPNLIAHMDMLPTRQSVEVPMFLYVSKGFRESHPAVSPDELLKKMAGKPFNTENLPHLLFGLTETKTSGYDAERDPSSSSYKETRKRIVSGSGTDYEKLKKASYEDILQNRDLK